MSTCISTLGVIQQSTCISVNFVRCYITLSIFSFCFKCLIKLCRCIASVRIVNFLRVVSGILVMFRDRFTLFDFVCVFVVIVGTVNRKWSEWLWREILTILSLKIVLLEICCLILFTASNFEKQTDVG